MLNGKRLVLASSAAITVSVAPILALASPAPRPLTAPTIPLSAGANQNNSGRLSTGHLFGKAVSTLARQVPAGPGHGFVISQFAKNNNPSNFHIRKVAASLLDHGKAHQLHGHNARQ